MSGCMKAPATTMAAKPATPAPAGAMMAKTPAAPPNSMAMTAKPTTAATGGKAKCKDGTVVTYKNRSGTCSGHKGVDTWM